MKIDPNESAFPRVFDKNNLNEIDFEGVSIRTYLAGKIASGLSRITK